MRSNGGVGARRRRGYKWALSGRTLSTRFAGTFPIKGKDKHICALTLVIPAKAGTQFIRLGPESAFA